ncbi:bifunctional protein PyrR [Planctomycetales bacterium]|nr:bifunctional protein PyrR [Planctomycetales bacterium]GHS96861.1 bifunctional protein PyrR [Planctomycetales bacterium]
MPTKLYDEKWVRSAIARMALAIKPLISPDAPLALIGVRTRGAEMADRVAVELRQSGAAPLVGYLDPTFFRDDLRGGAGLREMLPTDINFNLDGASVVLLDDVLLTGRSVRAAIDALFHYGRPRAIRLCVMVDRGGRELPIQPDICGAKIECPAGGWIRVKLQATDRRPDAVYVLGEGDSEP